MDGSINSSRLYGGTIRNAVFTDNSINTCTLSGGTLSYVYINKSILAAYVHLSIPLTYHPSDKNSLVT